MPSPGRRSPDLKLFAWCIGPEERVRCITSLESGSDWITVLWFKSDSLVAMTLSLDDAARPNKGDASLKFKEYFWISTGIVKDEDSRPRYLSDAANGMTLTIAKSVDNNDFFLSVNLPEGPEDFCFINTDLISVLLFAVKNYHSRPSADWDVPEEFRPLLAAFVDASINDNGTALNAEIEYL